MAVNTPTKTDGDGAGMAADLSFVESCAKNIARVSTTDKIVIEKSTLPVRTAEKIKTILKENNKNCHFEVISNPEFLAEGSAIQNLFKSDRVLIGGDTTESGKKAVKALVDIYSNWIPKNKIITSDHLKDQIIGRTTSGNYSFNYKKNLAFGYVKSEYSNDELGRMELYIEVAKQKYPVKVEFAPLKDKKARFL